MRQPHGSNDHQRHGGQDQHQDGRGHGNFDIAGGLLHDVGKLLEIEKTPQEVFCKSHQGKCARHPISGAILVAQAGLPDEMVAPEIELEAEDAASDGPTRFSVSEREPPPANLEDFFNKLSESDEEFRRGGGFVIGGIPLELVLLFIPLVGRGVRGRLWRREQV